VTTFSPTISLNPSEAQGNHFASQIRAVAKARLGCLSGVSMIGPESSPSPSQAPPRFNSLLTRTRLGRSMGPSILYHVVNITSVYEKQVKRRPNNIKKT
jgi:hypothetical protein